MPRSPPRSVRRRSTGTCGSARPPWRPYSRHRCHETFRGYWDYDAGGIGDMAQHYLDPLQYLLCKDDTSPVRVDYVGPRRCPGKWFDAVCR